MESPGYFYTPWYVMHVFVRLSILHLILFAINAGLPLGKEVFLFSRRGCYRKRRTNRTWSRNLEGVRRGKKMYNRFVKQSGSLTMHSLVTF